jgi:hypothetical protein
MTTSEEHAVTTAISPTTWTEAAKVAETITREELAALVAEHGAFTVFPGKGKQRQHAFFARMRPEGAGVYYERCTRNGFTADGYVSAKSPLPKWQPVFDFYQIGRVVTVA